MNPSLDPASAKPLSGGCRCGAVRYEVADEFMYAVYCHCSDCRRTTGSAFKPLAGIQRSKLKITQGHEGLLIFGDVAACHDVHCRVCGSLLYSAVDGGRYHVAMGTLIDAPKIRPTAHIFVSDKAPWHEITDSLPQHAEHA